MLDKTLLTDFQIQPLSDDQVDLWQIDLNCLAHNYGAFLSTLSPDEMTRANRFRRVVDRERFVNTRGALRMLLGRYLGIAPLEVVFVYNAFGKPLLADSSVRTLFFNVTHSRQAAAIGISQSATIGLDLEFADRIQDPDNLAKVCLSSREMQVYQQFRSRPATHANEKLHFVLERWTLKEAYLKGIGAGLSCPLADIDLQQTAEANERQFLVRHAGTFIHQWHLRLFAPDPTSRMALAIESRLDAAFPVIKFHQLSGNMQHVPEI